MRGLTLTDWRALPLDERAEILAYDEMERERRKSLLDETEHLNSESLLAWIFFNG